MQHSAKITTLFLDIGGVLLSNGWDRAARKEAARIFDLDTVELEERHHLTFDTYEEGKLTLDDYLTRIVFYEHREFTRNDFKEFMYSRTTPYSDMIDLICQLKEQYKLKIAIVNNEGRELNEYRIRTFGIDKFVDFFISSCFVHFRKPDADIWRMALDIALVRPEEVLYIEDRAMFIHVAEGLGINGLLHENFAKTVEKLKEWGLTVQ
ncbi:HAD family hydrolase [Chitinophaga sancti]|uniref:HAD hydrolase-like protein n=1 Tax=Chitinophaga sancti TaxID=1004 RepID=A0A1K1S5J6_9BACT|nr:HAD family hydrolase [Chitinophaga sancti]WQD63655.1 HAD hydrolase-like protein [Chitinophaga sancti]WQG90720.1 HAD hydrolase-like protein [Chitinophaga sancti]SFW79474.1 putative hydrolase of the HAD superfamily [Chitinophaga sancti]